MKKLIAVLTLSVIVFSCSDEVIEKKSQKDIEMAQLDSDPVIQYYSKYGTIEKAADGYQSPNCPECIDNDGIYFFTAFNGPLSTQTAEVFRYEREIDIPTPCDETFTLERRVHSYGNHESISCPVDGNDCKYVDASGRCLMIFCDETDC